MTQQPDDRTCPSCGSPDPARHPAVQFEGEVHICSDSFHRTVQPDDRKLVYAVNDYEPRIFITYKDGEYWATSTTEDYSYVVLPHDEPRNIEAARAAERERCARIAEHLNGWGYPMAPALAAHIAKVIRSGEP